MLVNGFPAFGLARLLSDPQAQAVPRAIRSTSRDVPQSLVDGELLAC